MEGKIQNILRNTILVADIELSMDGRQEQPPRVKDKDYHWLRQAPWEKKTYPVTQQLSVEGDFTPFGLGGDSVIVSKIETSWSATKLLSDHGPPQSGLCKSI